MRSSHGSHRERHSDQLPCLVLTLVVTNVLRPVSLRAKAARSSVTHRLSLQSTAPRPTPSSTALPPADAALGAPDSWLFLKKRQDLSLLPGFALRVPSALPPDNCAARPSLPSDLRSDATYWRGLLYPPDFTLLTILSLHGSYCLINIRWANESQTKSEKGG